MTEITLRVNGRNHMVAVDPNMPLLYALRDDLGLRGPKFGCGLGQCGACWSSSMARPALLRDARHRRRGKRSRRWRSRRSRPPSRVQAAFIAEQAAQCGYCTNGMIMTATALLARRPHPDRNRRARRAGAKSLPVRQSCAGDHRGPARRGGGLSHAASHRRSLLPGAAGLIVTFSLPRAPEQARRTVATDSVDAYLAIAPDGGVTVFAGKVDLGTGARAAIRQIVAEELGLSPGAHHARSRATPL